jgi:hypothetical protein
MHVSGDDCSATLDGTQAILRGLDSVVQAIPTLSGSSVSMSVQDPWTACLHGEGPLPYMSDPRPLSPVVAAAGCGGDAEYSPYYDLASADPLCERSDLGVVRPSCIYAEDIPVSRKPVRCDTQSLCTPLCRNLRTPRRCRPHTTHRGVLQESWAAQA